MILHVAEAITFFELLEVIEYKDKYIVRGKLSILFNNQYVNGRIILEIRK